MIVTAEREPLPVLHVQQVSTQFSDGERAFREDVKVALAREANLVGFTEVRSRERRTALRELCRSAGYYLHHPAGSSTAVAVRGARVLRAGQLLVHPGRPVPPSEGGYGPRYITDVTVAWQGNRVWFGEAHWVTPGLPGSDRRRHHEAMTRALIDEVELHGRGQRIAVFAGDTNVDDDAGPRAAQVPSLPEWLFAQAGLTTVWDELDQYPTTVGRSGRTIDVVGTYDPDKRISAVRAKAWPLGNSDHRAISAWFTVRPPRTLRGDPS